MAAGQTSEEDFKESFDDNCVTCSHLCDLLVQDDNEQNVRNILETEAAAHEDFRAALAVDDTTHKKLVARSNQPGGGPKEV